MDGSLFERFSQINENNEIVKTDKENKNCFGSGCKKELVLDYINKIQNSLDGIKEILDLKC
jgi:hypothetical protein